MFDHRSTGLPECGPTEFLAPEPCFVYFAILRNIIWKKCQWNHSRVTGIMFSTHDAIFIFYILYIYFIWMCNEYFILCLQPLRLERFWFFLLFIRLFGFESILMNNAVEISYQVQITGYLFQGFSFSRVDLLYELSWGLSNEISIITGHPFIRIIHLWRFFFLKSHPLPLTSIFLLLPLYDQFSSPYLTH